MGVSGRYMVVDWKTNRKFMVEPISERNQKVNDLTTTQGGIRLTKGGAVTREDSILDEDRFINVEEVSNPMDYIERKLNE